jgi:hypothetical protein
MGLGTDIPRCPEFRFLGFRFAGNDGTEEEPVKVALRLSAFDL